MERLVNTNILLPRQYAGVGQEVVDGYKQLITDPSSDPFDGKKLHPIPVVPLHEGIYDDALILANGTHRAVAYHQLRVPAHVKLFVSDEDIAACLDEPALMYYDTLAEFRHDYLTIVLPKMREFGRVTMSQYVQQHEAEQATYKR